MKSTKYIGRGVPEGGPHFGLPSLAQGGSAKGRKAAQDWLHGRVMFTRAMCVRVCQAFLLSGIVSNVHLGWLHRLALRDSEQDHSGPAAWDSGRQASGETCRANQDMSFSTRPICLAPGRISYRVRREVLSFEKERTPWLHMQFAISPQDSDLHQMEIV